MWCIDENAPGLVRMNMSGTIKEFPLSATGNAVSMAVGADGTFHVLAEWTNVIVATTKGRLKSIPIPSGDSTSIDGDALGPDGNVWFTEFDHIGKITPAAPGISSRCK